MILVVAGGIAWPAHAEIRIIPPSSEGLQEILDKAVDGDTIVLLPGTHRGPVRIARKLSLVGEKGAIVIGSNEGSVITVEAPEVVVRGLTIRGSGASLETMDSGVFVEQSAPRSVIEDNRIEGNLFGIYLHGAADAIARGNEVIGRQQARVSEAGNGVSVWNAVGAKILDNNFRFGRDGIFVITSGKNVISGNTFKDLRFAVHYMYANDGEITNNLSIGNTIGYTLMYSPGLEVRGNFSKDDRDRGLLFNYANNSRIWNNVVEGNLLPSSRWTSPSGTDSEHASLSDEGESASSTETYRPAPEKCVFIYNANNNQFRGNWFEGCEIGIHFTAGSEGNEIVGNAFVNNRNQVKYVGTSSLDWSKDGRGNYWSDNPGFDLNGDGIADVAYRPNDLVDKALWLAPQAKVLTNSPAIQVIRWAQTQFPALLPGGVVDTHPLIAPPPKPVPKLRNGS